MAWTIPTAKQIAASLTATVEAGFLRIRPELEPLTLSRTLRSPVGVMAQLLRAVALGMRSLHDHLAWWGRQYFIDQCDEDYVYWHAGIWGVEQRAATFAAGAVLIEGVPGEAIASDLELVSSSGAIYSTIEPAVISEFGSVAVPVIAAEAGTGGNLGTGVKLQVVTAYPAITRITVSTAITGGADEETGEELRAAVLKRIRERPHGGAYFDYSEWIRPSFAVQSVAVVEDWIGRGSLGVVVAMRDPDGASREPTTEELDAIDTHLDVLRPVTARVIVVPAELRNIDITVRLRPDNTATRRAITEAWQRFVETLGDEDDDGNPSRIGAVIEPSRLSEALSSAAGEYAHDLISPSAPIALERTEIATAGDITFEGA